MRFDTTDTESKQILREMKEIKRLCSEAYNSTDDVELKEHIQLMYEGKIWEKVKLLMNKVGDKLDVMSVSINATLKKVNAMAAKLPTKAALAILKKQNLVIENYQEFNTKEFVKILYSLKELEYFSKIKSGDAISLEDPAIVKILETSKNISTLKKEWKSKLMTAPRTAKYSDVGLKNADQLGSRYDNVLKLLNKRLTKLSSKVDSLSNEEANPNTVKVANAVTHILKALIGVVEDSIAKDASIQKRIWNALGKESITL